MNDLLIYITKQITDGGAQPEVVETEKEGSRVLTLKVPQEFVGLLIGKEGKTIRAIRNLVKAKSMLDRAKRGAESFERIFVRVEET